MQNIHKEKKINKKMFLKSRKSHKPLKSGKHPRRHLNTTNIRKFTFLMNVERLANYDKQKKSEFQTKE